MDWSRVLLFWSDERAVPPDHPDSNYRMAMEAGFKKVSIPPSQIHRMHAEEHIEENALKYEKTIEHVLQGRPFDLVMLGMGEDGHTASLFPHTEGLKVKDRLVIANYIPEKNAWRMTLTFPCINQAAHVSIYALGDAKKPMLKKVFENWGIYPIEQVGTEAHPALWIVDKKTS
jgi:6-phosphogluconolactonase